MVILIYIKTDPPKKCFPLVHQYRIIISVLGLLVSTVLWPSSYNKVVTSYSNYGVNIYIRETYRSTRNFSPVLLKFRNEISSTCHVLVGPLSTFTLFTLRAVHSWIVLWQCTVRLFNWVPTYSCTQPKFDLNADIYCVVLKKHLDSSMCLQFK